MHLGTAPLFKPDALARLYSNRSQMKGVPYPYGAFTSSVLFTRIRRLSDTVAVVVNSTYTMRKRRRIFVYIYIVVTPGFASGTLSCHSENANFQFITPHVREKTRASIKISRSFPARRDSLGERFPR